MTLRTWLFQNAPTGTVLTTANVRSVDNVAPTNLGTNTGTTTQTSSNSFAWPGTTYSAKFHSDAASTQVMRLPFTTSDVQVVESIAFYVPALPTASVYFWTIRNAGLAGRLQLTAAGKIGVVDAAGAFGTVSTASVVPGQWNRLLIKANALTTTTGTVTLEVFNGSAGTSYLTAAMTGNFGTTAFTASDFGTQSSSTSAFDIYFGPIQMDNATATDPGPYTVVNAKPTATIPSGNKDVAPSTPVTFTAVPVDTDGTIAAHEWAVVYSSTATAPTLSNATTATVGLTTDASTAGELWILSYRGQDNLGQWSDLIYVECRTPTSNTTVGFLPGNGAGAAWVNTGGAATIGAALSDSSDTTYAESPAYAASASIHWQRYRPMTPGAPGTVVNRHAETATGGTTNFLLAEGSAQTIRSTQPLTQSTTIANETDDISAATISDWSSVWGGMSVAT